jgi:glycosyltransferase involved in cell wall biosynthesis
MRLLITAPWGESLGGAEAMLQGVLSGEGEDSHEIEVVFLQSGPWPEQLRQSGVHVTVIDAGRLRHVHRWVKTVLTLARLLRARKPDLILNWSAKTHMYGAPAAVLAGMADRLIWWQQAIPEDAWIDRLATLLPARAIACYSKAAADAQERMRPSRPTFVIAAGSPPPTPATPVALPLPDDVPVVGLVGRLQPWKGQDRMLRAQALAREHGYEFHLLIVGGDSYNLSPEYAASLGGLAEQLGLSGAVTMTGQVPDAAPYIERMDVLVNASDPEPFGIVLLEGMARGVAVLAVNSGGPSEFIQDGETGVLARSGEPHDLAEGLERLLASPELRERLGRAGRESYEADYTEAAMRARFFAEFERVLRG